MRTADLDSIDRRVSHEFAVNKRLRLLIHRATAMCRADRKRISRGYDVARECEAYAKHLRETATPTPDTILRSAYAERVARDIRKALA